MSASRKHIRMVLGEEFYLLKDGIAGLADLKNQFEPGSFEQALYCLVAINESVMDRIVRGDLRAATGTDEFELPVGLKFSAEEKLFLAALRARNAESVLRHLNSPSSGCVATADDDGQGRFVKSRPCSEGGGA